MPSTLSDLMHRMNEELAEFNIRVIQELCNILIPDMVGFAGRYVLQSWTHAILQTI